MVRAIMHGCNGKMGQVITGLVRDDEGIEFVAGVDSYTGIENAYPVFEKIGQCDVEADVIIDFSNARAVESANMSLGINLLMKLLKDAAKVLGAAGFDMEVVERHHNQKVDAPSGTALALADSMNESMDHAYEYVYDRSKARQKRGKKEIGISAVRGGTIVGDHEAFGLFQDGIWKRRRGGGEVSCREAGRGI